MVRRAHDGTYLTVLIKPTIRGPRRERLLAAARAGQDLTDINTVPDAFDERGCRSSTWPGSSSTTCPTGTATAPAS